MSVVIPQTHAEWLQERRNGLGASDSGIILGVNPWKTNVDLWSEKTGLHEAEDISDKPQVKYGHDAEPHIRALFALDHQELKVTYESPYKIIRSDTFPFIFCTPDGEITTPDGRKGGLEIKTTEIMNARQWAEWKGRIPDTYYCQVCHQMLAAHWEFVYLVAQIKWTTKEGEMRKDTREYLINRDECIDDILFLQDQLINFWKCVEEKTEPPLKLPAI